jgi:hypothetical protein
MQLTNKFKNAVPYLLGLIISIYIVKPSIFFKPNGKSREYGFGYDEEGYKKTLYTFQFAIIIAAVLLYTFL